MRAAALLLVAVALSGAGAAAHADTVAGPVAAARPTVSGKLQQGQKLTANPGTWSGSGTIAYSYQWYRCDTGGAHCSSVHGATKATYTLVAKDVGRTLGLTVNAKDTTGTTAAYASLIGIVAPAGSTLVPLSQPPLTGDPIVGQPLKVEAATWSATPTATTYTWLRCNANTRICVTIAGATTDTYTVATADVGHTLLAWVTGTSGTTKAVVLSSSSGLARTSPGPVPSGRPSIAGTLQQGKKLTASAGTWAGSGTIAYAYQWYRCDMSGAHCSSVHGATGQGYTLVAADSGKTIGLTVKATDATGSTAGYSSLAGVVAPATSTLAITAQPTLSGTPAVGQTLKVSGGAFTATPASATYAWLRCNVNGRICTAITGATTDSYVVTTADTAHTLVASVTATAGTATQVALTTAATIPG